MSKRSRSNSAAGKTAPRKRVAVSKSVPRKAQGFSGYPKLVKEVGYVDVAFAGYALDTTGSITLLNTVAQGASTSERIGKKIMMKSLQIHGHSAVGTAVTRCSGAYIVVYDKRPTGTLPNITDVLNSVHSASFNNDANSGRFRILKRVAHEMVGSAANNFTSKTAYDEDSYLPLKNLPVVYKSAGTGAIGDIEQGALYLITVGDTAAGTSAAILNAGFRLRYNDVN